MTTEITAPSLAARLFNRTRIACMALSLAPLACMMEGEEDLELDEPQTNVAGPQSFVAEPVTPEVNEQLAELGVERVGDVWLDDCNVCMLTEDGPACTTQSCEAHDVEGDDVVDGPLSFCEDGLYAEGDIWADACNLCLCTAEGTVCTMTACDQYADVA